MGDRLTLRSRLMLKIYGTLTDLNIPTEWNHCPEQWQGNGIKGLSFGPEIGENDV